MCDINFTYARFWMNCKSYTTQHCAIICLYCNTTHRYNVSWVHSSVHKYCPTCKLGPVYKSPGIAVSVFGGTHVYEGGEGEVPLVAGRARDSINKPYKCRESSIAMQLCSYVRFYRAISKNTEFSGVQAKKLQQASLCPVSAYLEP